MNPKSDEHFQFLSSLTYFDASEFVISSSQTLPKTHPDTQHKNNTELNDSQIQDVFSMQYTKEFNQVKEFIESPDENMPLLIKSPKHTGKKSLLCQIINHYQRHDNKTKIFIANFASVNKVYSQILYSIMVKLRITFGINQKVQVNQQKIRRFFKYWLDVSSEKIEKDNIGYSKNEKQTLCIIIEGIDQLTNSAGEKVFPEFWLPQYLPKNVRLILSGTEGEMPIEKLQQQGHVKVMTLGHKVLSEKLKSKLKPQIRDLLEQRPLSLFQIKTVSWFLTLQQKLKIPARATFHEMMAAYIAECTSKLKQNQIKSLILCLCLSKKGLTRDQLLKIMRLGAQQVNKFLYMFEPLIDKYDKFQGYYLITNPEVKNFIEKVYDPNRDKGPKYHEIIGKVIKKGELSIRKLEEEIYHLKMAGNYFEIKEVVTQIENFLVLYTPPCKYLLCSTWKILETHLKSDPVFEYNKAIESFLTHYHPKEEQLFKITFQLSMFFREYSEFEGAKIPSFRHPLIKGDEEQLQQICVFQELRQHKMTSALKIVVKKNLDINNITFTKTREMKLAALSPGKQSKHRSSVSSELQLGSGSKWRETHEQTITAPRQTDQIEEIQCLNLQIKLNREKFKQSYLNVLKPYLKQFYVPVKKLMHNDKFVKSSNTTQEEQEDTEQLPSQMSQILSRDVWSQIQNAKSSMILKSLDEYLEQNYHREQITEFYYYKEWMWIQFPWICQSLNYDFSQMIQKYIASPTEYMSLDVELGLIKDVLKISQVSKENKSAIYQKQNIQLIAIKPNKLKKKPRSNLSNMSVIPNETKENQQQPSNQSRLSPSAKNNNPAPHDSLNNSNLAKFELNLSQIDKTLKSEIGKQLTHRLVYDSRVLAKSRAKLNTMLNYSVNDSSPFLTEASNKENSSMILPKIGQKLSQSKFAFESRSKLNSSKLNQSKIQGDSKRVRMLNELNDLQNQNQQLKSMIQNVQKTSLMLDNINETPQNQQIQNKLTELTSAKSKIQKKQQIQSQLKQKLQTIIKICDNNKSHQMESQLLCTFLDNLKTMCRIEDKQKEITMKEFTTFADKHREQINTLIAKKNTILGELKQFGDTVQFLTQKNIEEDDQLTEKTRSKNLPSDCLVEKEQKKFQRQKPQKASIISKHDSSYSIKKTTKQRNRTLARQTNKSGTITRYPKLESPAIWEELSAIFQYDVSEYQQSVENSHYLMEEFKEKITKFRELSFLYDQLAYEGDSLDEKIWNLEEELNTVRQKNEAFVIGKKENKGLMSESWEMKEKSKHLEEVRKRSEILEECLKKYTVTG